MKAIKDIEYMIDAFIAREVLKDLRRQLSHQIIPDSKTIELASSKTYFCYLLNNISADEALYVLESDLSYYYRTFIILLTVFSGQ